MADPTPALTADIERRVAEIEVVHNAAPGGMWQECRGSRGDRPCQCGMVWSEDGGALVAVPGHHVQDCPHYAEGAPSAAIGKAIASARQNIPWLLATVRSLSAQLAAARRQITDLENAAAEDKYQRQVGIIAADKTETYLRDQRDAALARATAAEEELAKARIELACREKPVFSRRQLEERVKALEEKARDLLNAHHHCRGDEWADALRDALSPPPPAPHATIVDGCVVHGDEMLPDEARPAVSALIAAARNRLGGGDGLPAQQPATVPREGETDPLVTAYEGGVDHALGMAADRIKGLVDAVQPFAAAADGMKSIGLPDHAAVLRASADYCLRSGEGEPLTFGHFWRIKAALDDARSAGLLENKP